MHGDDMSVSRATLRLIIASLMARSLIAGPHYAFAADILVPPECTQQCDKTHGDHRVECVRACQCTSAFESLPQQLKQDDRNVSDSFIASNAQKLDNYDTKCFESLQALRTATRALVGGVSGTLFLSGGGTDVPWCSAFRLTPKLLVTARHCMWEKDNRLDPRSMKFSLLGTPGQVFRVTGERNPLGLSDLSTNIDDNSDIWVLESDTAQVPMPTLAVFVARKPSSKMSAEGSWLPLLIPAFNAFAWRLHRDVGDSNNFVRVDDLSSCQLDNIDSKGQCLIYSCQTLGTMSGAAIYGYRHDKDTWEVMGIHLRPGSLQRSCGSPNNKNVGVLLLETLIGDGRE
jgi:hypothetical protein